MASRKSFRELRDRDPFRWNQAADAIRFKYMRNGITLTATAEQIAAYLDPTQRQDWRIPPPQGALPRVDASWLPDPQMFDSSNHTRLYTRLGDRLPSLTPEKRVKGTQAFNEVSRGLAEIVSWLEPKALSCSSFLCTMACGRLGCKATLICERRC